VTIPQRCDSSSLFDCVYQRHYRVVYAYIFGQVQEADASADVLQDTFVRVWRHVNDLSAIPQDRQLYWILGIARNQTRDYYRRRVVRNRVEQNYNVSLVQAAGDPHEELQTKETQSAVDAAIRALPPSLRVPLTLSVMGGLNSKEIAGILERPAGTVRYQIAEARKRISRHIGLQDGSEE